MSTLQRYLNHITEDHGNWWVGKYTRFKFGLLAFLSGLLVKISSGIKHIEMGRNNKFVGLPYFHRHPFSRIIIGNSCTFRSDKKSNLIGVNRKCLISTHSNEAIISIGDSSGFSGVSIGAAKEITIGKNVLCGANVVITDFDWHSDISNTEPKPVRIEDNVWIGLNCVVLKGVTIGANSIIGANSLVTRDIPANVIAAGNPCKVVKVIQDQHS